jgi:hypothetical protein
VHHGDPRHQGIDDGIVIGMVLGRKFLNRKRGRSCCRRQETETGYGAW